MAAINILRLRGAILVVGAIITALTLTACNGTSKSSEGVNRPAAAPGNQGGQDAGSGPKAPATGAPINPASLQRSIIYQGTITVRVNDINTAAAAASSMAVGAGGYVGGDNRVVDATRSTATLTLRVPAAKFEGAVDAISHLGKELNREMSTQDVTAAVIDVDSRVKTQQASVDRIRALLAQANSISEIVSLESELTSREADLESLQAQQRNLSDLTSLSTITATLLGPEAGPVAAKPDHGGFVGGLKSGWHTFLASLRVLLLILGAILPFALIIGVPVLIAIAVLRRAGRRGAAGGGTQSPALSTAGGAAGPGGRLGAGGSAARPGGGAPPEGPGTGAAATGDTPARSPESSEDSSATAVEKPESSG
jgi:hypothetical protein